MRRLISSWSNTLRQLGYKAAKKSQWRAPRRCGLETLEPRWVFSTTHMPTPFLVGNCTDDCPCSCSQVSTTSDSMRDVTRVSG